MHPISRPYSCGPRSPISVGRNQLHHGVERQRRPLQPQLVELGRAEPLPGQRAATLAQLHPRERSAGALGEGIDEQARGFATSSASAACIGLRNAGHVLRALAAGEWMAMAPVPLDPLRLHSATSAYVSITLDCQLAVEAFAQAAGPGGDSEAALDLVTQVTAALDSDRTGSPARTPRGGACWPSS
jgi:hypothetical protein